MKILILLAAALALFISASGGSHREKDAHIGVIGGSDGPTAVFITRNSKTEKEQEAQGDAAQGPEAGAENGTHGEE